MTTLRLLAFIAVFCSMVVSYPYNPYYQEPAQPWYQSGSSQRVPYRIGTGVRPTTSFGSSYPYYPYYQYNWNDFNTDYYNPYNNH